MPNRLRSTLHGVLSFTILFYTPLSSDAQLTISVGQHEVVFESGYAGLNYFPDEPISLVSRKPFSFFLVNANKTVLMQGKTFETAMPVRDVLLPGKPGEFDNGYAGVTSVVMKDKRILALYHAEDHVGGKISHAPVSRAYWSVGLASANIDDQAFTKNGQVLSASVTRDKMKATDDHMGIGDATIIEDATGKFYFAYFTDLTRKPTNPMATIGMARCTVESRGAPGAWKKFYNGQFNEPGLGGLESPVVYPPKAFPSDVSAAHVTYIKSLEKYVMVCNVMAYSDHEKKEAELGGIYYAESDDGVKWSEPKLLVVGHPVPYVGRKYQAHPHLVIEKDEKNKVSGWLLYCYSKSWGTENPHKPHYLCRRKVRIEVK